MRALHLIALIGAVGLLSPAMAEAPPGDLLATYGASNGTVPPPYRQSYSVVILVSGAAVLEVCKGYGRETGSCVRAEFQVEDAARTAILDAARASGLKDDPAVEMTDPPVGGSATGGTAMVDGAAIYLPAFPVEADAERVAGVLQAIAAVIPADVLARAESGAKAPE